MTILHVKIHQIHKKQALEGAAQIIQRGLNAGGISCGVIAARQTAMGKNILNFSHAQHVHARFLHSVQQRRGDRLQREIPPPGGAGKPACAGAHKGPGDHTAHRMLPHQLFPGDLAHFVKPGQGNNFLMRGDLKHAVGGGVHDGIPRAHVLLPQFIQNRRARGGLVAQRLCADGFLKCADNLLREAVGIGGKRSVQRHPRHFPMAGGGILALGLFRRAAKRAAAVFLRFQPQAGQMPQAQRLHVGNIQGAIGGDMPQGVSPGIAESGGIGQRPCAHAVQYD